MSHPPLPEDRMRLVSRRGLALAGGGVVAAGAAVGGVWAARALGLNGGRAEAASTAPAAGVSAALARGGPWLNTPGGPPDLQGRVALIYVWTYSCINSLRPLPYVRAWAQRYRDLGFVVVGVHAPEFGFEQDLGNVRRALAEQGVDFPVALDNGFRIWRAFGNNAWPSFYFIGADGRPRGKTEGEGNYERAELLIRELLAQAHPPGPDGPTGPLPAQGVQVAPDWAHLQNEETYVGYAKAQGFAGGDLTPDAAETYRAPGSLALGRWGLAGGWTVGQEFAAVDRAQARLAFRFHARDLNLVLAPGADGRPGRFHVRLDGADPGADHGTDTDAQGWGEVREPRLYQLARQAGPVAERTFEIEFQAAGPRAYVFTFG